MHYTYINKEDSERIEEYFGKLRIKTNHMIYDEELTQSPCIKNQLLNN